MKNNILLKFTSTLGHTRLFTGYFHWIHNNKHFIKVKDECLFKSITKIQNYQPANIYLFKVSNRKATFSIVSIVEFELSMKFQLGVFRFMAILVNYLTHFTTVSIYFNVFSILQYLRVNPGTKWIQAFFSSVQFFDLYKDLLACKIWFSVNFMCSFIGTIFYIKIQDVIEQCILNPVEHLRSNFQPLNIFARRSILYD